MAKTATPRPSTTPSPAKATLVRAAQISSSPESMDEVSEPGLRRNSKKKQAKIYSESEEAEEENSESDGEGEDEDDDDEEEEESSEIREKKKMKKKKSENQTRDEDEDDEDDEEEDEEDEDEDEDEDEEEEEICRRVAISSFPIFKTIERKQNLVKPNSKKNKMRSEQ
jgi:TATA-binding protein-associated factor Taf7